MMFKDKIQYLSVFPIDGEDLPGFIQRSNNAIFALFWGNRPHDLSANASLVGEVIGGGIPNVNIKEYSKDVSLPYGVSTIEGVNRGWLGHRIKIHEMLYNGRVNDLGEISKVEVFLDSESDLFVHESAVKLVRESEVSDEHEVFNIDTGYGKTILKYSIGWKADYRKVEGKYLGSSIIIYPNKCYNSRRHIWTFVEELLYFLRTIVGSLIPIKEIRLTDTEDKSLYWYHIGMERFMVPKESYMPTPIVDLEHMGDLVKSYFCKRDEKKWELYYKTRFVLTDDGIKAVNFHSLWDGKTSREKEREMVEQLSSLYSDKIQHIENDIGRNLDFKKIACYTTSCRNFHAHGDKPREDKINWNYNTRVTGRLIMLMDMLFLCRELEKLGYPLPKHNKGSYTVSLFEHVFTDMA